YREMLLQITLDTVLLSALLFYTGGYTNPLISLYLFPVLVAGLTLHRYHAWMVAMLTIIAYTLLMRFYQPLFAMHDHEMLPHEFQVHLLGMWLTFVLSVLLLIIVIVRMSEQQREREVQLSEWQQRSIREHTIVALGAQAASDAHELGTPLNTLLLITDGLAATELSPELRQQVDLMQQQLLYCRHILRRLNQRAQRVGSRGEDSTPLTIVVEQSAMQWQNLHPEIRVDLTQQLLSTATIKSDQMLERSIFVLLDNAVEAGATRVELELGINHGLVVLTVCDNGQGFNPLLLDSLGTEPVTTKSDGRGLGLYLTSFMIDKMQGGISFTNLESGGAQVTLQWPVNSDG
ncbi:MAG: ATP-binding protein, partial [Mariprofundales bacterium]|nr:ATP-binding protein [Mariprofundales bacterium]